MENNPSMYEVSKLMFEALHGEREELGIVFCANCGNTPCENVTFEDIPNENCGNCGFSEWIWEPIEDGE